MASFALYRDRWYCRICHKRLQPACCRGHRSPEETGRYYVVVSVKFKHNIVGIGLYSPLSATNIQAHSPLPGQVVVCFLANLAIKPIAKLDTRTTVLPSRTPTSLFHNQLHTHPPTAPHLYNQPCPLALVLVLFESNALELNAMGDATPSV